MKYSFSKNNQIEDPAHAFFVDNVSWERQLNIKCYNLIEVKTPHWLEQVNQKKLSWLPCEILMNNLCLKIMLF